jgi:ectoine hydroxylase-related dioxygenase (phytanoyl-CoA dioxygenase family)
MNTTSNNFQALTKSQQDSFFTNGYLCLPGMVPAPLLKKLRELFVELINDKQHAEEKVIHVNKGKSYITNLDNICPKSNLSCLELLGSPFILEIASTICGDDFFLIQEFAVIKWAGDELPVLWHQDMTHHRSGKCFTMGIYLDDAPEGDGALRILPGSHLANKSICELSKEPFIEIPMKTGDILIHDMMLAHSSGLLHKNQIRKVIYFEFLSAAHALKENIYSSELVNRRTRLLFAASSHYQLLHPDEKPFIHKKLNPDPEDDKKDLRQILIEIYNEPIKARPSTYCFEHINIQNQ